MDQITQHWTFDNYGIDVEGATELSKENGEAVSIPCSTIQLFDGQM